MKKFQKPLTTHKYRKSWVYKYGYRVVERHNPRCVHWICHWCFKHRATEFGRGIYHTTGSISAAKRHLEEDKPGHYKFKPGTDPPPAGSTEDNIYDTLQAGKLRVSQSVANLLSSFDITLQQFRLAAVG